MLKTVECPLRALCAAGGGVGWIELLLFKLPKHDSNWYGTRTLLTKNEPPRPKKSIRDR